MNTFKIGLFEVRDTEPVAEPKTITELRAVLAQIKVGQWAAVTEPGVGQRELKSFADAVRRRFRYTTDIRIVDGRLWLSPLSNDGLKDRPGPSLRSRLIRESSMADHPTMQRLASVKPKPVVPAGHRGLPPAAGPGKKPGSHPPADLVAEVKRAAHHLTPEQLNAEMLELFSEGLNYKSVAELLGILPAQARKFAATLALAK